MQDMGTIIMGKIESGALRKGESLCLMPNKATIEILSILSDDEERSDALTGENVKLKVRGVEEEVRFKNKPNKPVGPETKC